MSKALSIFTVSALVAVLFLGFGSAFAYTSGVPTADSCSKAFQQLDSGNKGYLNYSDWEAGHYGLGAMKGVGPAPAGNATNFYSMDFNGDNQVTFKEFCSFKAMG